MKKIILTAVFLTAGAILLPNFSYGQTHSDVQQLHATLQKLYDEMLPLCRGLIDVGRAIAGLAALTFIAVRVWRHIANAEPVDFYPLLRPFAIGMAILLFPMLLGLLNGVLQPITNATGALVQNTGSAVDWHIEQEKKIIQKRTPWSGDANSPLPDEWQKYIRPEAAGDQDIGWLGMSFGNLGKQLLREVLNVIYIGAALCIDTLRTFYLIILAILGPLILGLSVFDGFQATLSTWLARYINVSLWLPIANIFGAITAKIQQNLYLHDQDTSSSVAYLIFMLIAIVGYFTVPTIASHIVQVGGKDSMVTKVTNYFEQFSQAALQRLDRPNK